VTGHLFADALLQGLAGMTTTLSTEELDAFLASQRRPDCIQWSLVDGKLCASLKFETFKEAFAFMTAVALYAESRDHHPEWSNTYNRLQIALTTHSAGGITNKDIDLATYISRTYSKHA
jgi:4a-hydroxytetrahydrobiopterin dehydratase